VRTSRQKPPERNALRHLGLLLLEWSIAGTRTPGTATARAVTGWLQAVTAGHAMWHQGVAACCCVAEMWDANAAADTFEVPGPKL